MTREEIIRMAREAGYTSYDSLSERLHEFAAIVATAEREACVRICLDTGLSCEVRHGADLCFELSEVIRERSKG